MECRMIFSKFTNPKAGVANIVLALLYIVVLGTLFAFALAS